MPIHKQPKTVADIIAGALELFGKNGENWIPGNLRSSRTTNDGEHHNTYCALGAISAAASANGRSHYCTSGVSREAADLVAQHIPNAGDEHYSCIPSWNDSLPAGKRGFRSIKAVFCKALKLAIAQEQPAKRKTIMKKGKKRA